MRAPDILSGVDFRLLGPVQIQSSTGELTQLLRRKERLALAVLLLEPGRVIPTDRLIDLLWADAPPATARTTLQTLMSRIRTALRTAAAAGESVPELAAKGPGYVLNVAPESVDLHRFRALLDEARTTADPETRSARLTAALELWRGPALADAATGDIRDLLCGGLEEARFAAICDRIDADLDAGRHTELVAELSQLTAEYPLREQLHVQLMTALQGSGRRAEALAAYQHTRRVLRTELGLAPGQRLRELEASILAGGTDPAPAPAEPAVPPVPAQLPSDLTGFVGRAGDLGGLDALLGTRPTAVITGTAGVGKTTLAVHWAHRVREQFPDGQLYVDLRGFDPTGTALDPADALRDILDALQVPADRIPAALDARTGLFRTVLSARRILLILDNAADARQVRPLLPGSAGSMAVVTSRSPLTALVATEGAHLLPLDLLSTAEAAALLTRRLEYRAADDTINEIIASCARLPLALAIAASRATTTPGLTAEALAGELRDAAGRLDAFTLADASNEVRAVFSCSYRGLEPDTARLFRLLALHPGPDFTAPSVAALAGADAAHARAMLAGLTRTHLVSERKPGRYAFHDLLRAYARELVGRVPEADRNEALHRLLDHYLQTANRAANVVTTERDPVALTPPLPGTVVADFSDHDQAMDWFAAEHPVLLAAITHAGRTGFADYAWQLSWAVSPYLARRGRWAEHAATLRAILPITGRSGLAQVHRLLGIAEINLADRDEARNHFGRALELARESGDRFLEADAHYLHGWLSTLEDRNAEAVVHVQHSLNLYWAIGHRPGQAKLLNAVGWMRILLGRHEEAIGPCREALALLEELGNRARLAHTWDTVGCAHHHLGRYDEAVDCFRRSLEYCRQNGNRRDEADALTHLGDTRQAAGDTGSARAAWQQALAILDDIGHPEAQAVRDRLQTAALPEVTG
jgi:DNA-binding SARP family transcriptional activator